MYLIAAEGYYLSGNSNESKKYLNMLQAKRKATPTSLNDETIQKEWLRETVCEGLRLSNMKRWEIGFEGRAPQKNAAGLIVDIPKSSYSEKAMEFDDRAMCWPIPTYERKINPNLVQNPGYGTN